MSETGKRAILFAALYEEDAALMKAEGEYRSALVLSLIPRVISARLRQVVR